MSDGRISLIGIDLDGTLLTTDKRLTPRTRQDLLRVIEKGVTVMVATGRPLNAIPPEVLDISGIRYLMASNGALIYDRQAEKPIYHRCLKPETLREVWRRLQVYNLWKEVSVNGIAHVSRYAYEHVTELLPDMRSHDYLLNSRKPEEDMEIFLADQAENAEKLCIFFDDSTLLDTFFELFSDLPDLYLTSASDNNFEASDREAQKGKTLYAMADLLGIPHEGIMAFGDNLNDLSMIEAAGLGVAMGNGHPDLKAAADYVTCGNNEEGVADALEKLGIV